jgi:hypothetical protein
MRVVLVLVALLALSGCTSRPLPPPVTQDGVEDFLARQLDSEWELVGIADANRPYPPRVRFVTTVEYANVMSLCTTKVAPGYRRVLPTKAADDLAYYYCQVQYPIDPSEYLVLSTAQIDYLYDYYLRWTIPCLETQGYPAGPVPSRAEFRAYNGYWNPLYHPGRTTDISSDEYARLDADCGITVIDRFPTN